MQRSSPSIGTLASALAKAQGELVNPEKSLVATIRPDGPQGIEQTFRYAPLSSGLDIVRKVLGQHEIATVQTTSIDQDAGLINLTTVLAHASGEWIASDWPVCPISETATPHRMGASLTYARRYALFTLVGIAGEDDLDAPNLMTPMNKTPIPETPKGPGNGQFSGTQHKAALPGRREANVHAQAKPILGTEASAQLRDRLIAEVHELGSSDDAAIWAHKIFAEKNILIAEDAQVLEEAFQAMLEALEVHGDGADPSNAEERNLASLTPREPNEPAAKPKHRRRSRAIDKGVLAMPEPRRVRDRDHVKSVAQHPCLICGRRPADAHHLRFVQSKALGRKVSDEFTVPLCRGHHRALHRGGDEGAWWKNTGVDPIVAARSLWLKSHPLPISQNEVTPNRRRRPDSPRPPLRHV
jgi:ERF superfamily